MGFDMARIRVAILGAGRIAQHMADTLVKMAADSRYADLVEPYAVAARDAGRAADFATKYGFPVSYGSYEELVSDPNVDLVYIATPHNLHAEQAILCMKAGKGVLVEKAFGANAAQSRDMLDISNETGMLCTEAIWTRYMPSRGMIDDIIASGIIGDVQAIDANLCYPTTAKARITDPALAGGALLDVGVYPINFIDMIMHNAPIARIESSMRPYETGVDAHNSMTFYYENGRQGLKDGILVGGLKPINDVAGIEQGHACLLSRLIFLTTQSLWGRRPWLKRRFVTRPVHKAK